MSDSKHLWKKAKKRDDVPIFDYRCSNKECLKQYEYFHKNSDDKVPECPHCGCNYAKKLVSTGTSGVVKGANAKNRYGLKR
jgi:putative FmdB family regulatory protein